MRKLSAVLFLLLCNPLLRADVPLTPKSSVDDVLSALQARGQNLTDFTADVRHSSADPAVMHETIETGKLFFQRLPDGDTRIRVNFDTKKAGSLPQVKWHREYLLAKGYVTDQDFDGKTETRRQVLKPGQKMDPLKLGEGPFPLPIGQEPAEVKKNFEPKIDPPAKDDPEGTIHLELKPKANTRFARKFDLIEVWVDVKTNFTPRITVTSLNDTEVVTTDLSNLKINAGLKDADFVLSPPAVSWSVNEEALQE